MKKEYFNWKRFDEACEKMAKQLKNKKIKTIYGIPRGGLVLAIKLSHLLDLKIVSTPTKADLIVDEICDTGKTLVNYRKKYKNKLFATIHLKEDCSIIPEVYIYKTKNRPWIVYPWEK